MWLAERLAGTLPRLLLTGIVQHGGGRPHTRAR